MSHHELTTFGYSKGGAISQKRIVNCSIIFIAVAALFVVSPLSLTKGLIGSVPGSIRASAQTFQRPAAIITVNSGADADGTCPGVTCTLRQAIASASAGDTINFNMVTVTSPINLTSGELLINKSLTIVGPGAGALTVQRSTAANTKLFRIFHIALGEFDVSISGLTASNGNPTVSDLNGGAILNQSVNKVTLDGCAISGNLPGNGGHGGGIYNTGNLSVSNSTFSGNKESIYTTSFLNFSNSSVSTDQTIGITNTGSANLVNSSFSGGQNSFENLGTEFNRNVSSTISGSSFSAATLAAIYNLYGSMIIENSTISGNTATGIDTEYGATSISGCTIANNGNIGIYNYSRATLYTTVVSPISILNSTITGNGIGVFHSVGIASLSNNTIYGNVTGFTQDNNTLTPRTVNALSNIIAGNSGGQFGKDVTGNFISQGYNLIGIVDGGSGFTNGINNDQVGTVAAPVNPLLGPLAANGGSTMTMAPLNGSPALDKGSSGGLKIDQRGSIRPSDDPSIPNAPGGDGSDIGSYERLIGSPTNPCSPNSQVTVMNSNDAGPGSLRDTIANACAGSTITFDPGVTGFISLTSGELVIEKSLTINGPGSSVLTIQRSHVAGTPNFRVFNITFGNRNVTISGLTISNGNTTGNTLKGGGGIHSDSTGSVTIINSEISGNSTPDQGAGIYNKVGQLTISGCLISGNSSTGTDGGGIYNNGYLRMSNSTVTANNESFLDLARGGGISNYLFGTLILIDSTISNNTASATSSSLLSGAGIHNSGAAYIYRSTISGNVFGGTVLGSGAGICNASTLAISNSTLTGNAAGPGAGGGIYGYSAFTDVKSSTIAGNSATYGGGIYGYSDNYYFKLSNSIVAGNSASQGPDIDTPVTSLGYNLIGNNKDSSLFPETGDQIGTPTAPIDPKLAPLANNGGATQTMALLPTSPSVDQGSLVDGVSTDQRGQVRPFDDPANANAAGGNGSDIGAYESQIPLAPPLPTPTPIPTPTPSPTPPACSSIIAWYKFEGNLNDSVGGNNATLQQNSGIITYVPGMAGQGMQINDGAIVRVTDSAAIRPLSAVTVEAWVKASGNNNNNTRGDIIFKAGNSYALQPNATGLLFNINNGVTRPSPATGAIWDGTFHHVAGTYANGSRVRMYLDGVELPFAQRVTGNLNYTANSDLYIGSTNSRNSFAGVIDELTIYNRELSGDEIKAIYDAGTSGKCNAVVSVTVSGRVLTPSGLGLRNAVVSIVDPQGTVRRATTSSFGFYTLSDVPAGGPYTVTVASKRYRFTAQVVQLTGDLSNFDFNGVE